MWGLGKKHRSGNQGLSLVELLVVSGISMVILLAFTQYQTQLAKQVKSIDQGAVYQSLVNSAKLWTAEKTSCSAILRADGDITQKRIIRLEALFPDFVNYASGATLPLPDTLDPTIPPPRLRINRLYGKCGLNVSKQKLDCGGDWPPVMFNISPPATGPARYNGLFFHTAINGVPAHEADGVFVEPDWKQLVALIKAGGSAPINVPMGGRLIVRASRGPVDASNNLITNRSIGSPRFFGANERWVELGMTAEYDPTTKVLTFDECWNADTAERSLLELKKSFEFPGNKTQLHGVGMLFTSTPSRSLAFVGLRCRVDLDGCIADDASGRSKFRGGPPGAPVLLRLSAPPLTTGDCAANALTSPECTMNVPLWNYDFAPGGKSLYRGRVNLAGTPYDFCIDRNDTLHLRGTGTPPNIFGSVSLPPNVQMITAAVPLNATTASIKITDAGYENKEIDCCGLPGAEDCPSPP
jgi:hypothetical protein